MPNELTTDSDDFFIAFASRRLLPVKLHHQLFEVMANLHLYMVDFACFNAPNELRVNFHEAHEAALKNWKVTRKNSGYAQCRLRTAQQCA
jgi:hypothetical protein